MLIMKHLLLMDLKQRELGFKKGDFNEKNESNAVKGFMWCHS